MRWLKTIAAEVYGLFVDDGSFALALLLWPAACALLLPRLGVRPAWLGAVLACGLLAILAESALRAAGRARR